MKADPALRRGRRANPDEFRARVWGLAGTMSQGAIARELGVSQNLVWKILREKPDEPQPADNLETL